MNDRRVPAWVIPTNCQEFGFPHFVILQRFTTVELMVTRHLSATPPLHPPLDLRVVLVFVLSLKHRLLLQRRVMQGRRRIPTPPTCTNTPAPRRLHPSWRRMA